MSEHNSLDGRARDSLGRLLPSPLRRPWAESPEAKLDRICSLWGVLSTEEEVERIPNDADRAEAYILLLQLQTAQDERARVAEARRIKSIEHLQQVRLALVHARFERLKEAIRVALIADPIQSRAKLARSLGCCRTTFHKARRQLEREGALPSHPDNRHPQEEDHRS